MLGKMPSRSGSSWRIRRRISGFQLHQADAARDGDVHHREGSGGDLGGLSSGINRRCTLLQLARWRHSVATVLEPVHVAEDYLLLNPHRDEW